MATMQKVPFTCSDGHPLQDVSEFAQVLDWVVLVDYDARGHVVSSPLA